MIDWSKLKPYERDQYRSFEELCYQIAKGLYGDLGRFTSIDDSGGGDGVEFYLTLPNGEQWGWQAKLYYPDGSLRISNRQTSIKKSLQTACERHPRLTKWFLCTPRNLTPNDQEWFDQQLAQSEVNNQPVVPAGHNVILENWAESDFINWLSEPRFTGKRLFFFGELELSLDWFVMHVQKQMAAVRDRFNPLLHTETHIDIIIHKLLGDESFAQRIRSDLVGLENQFKKYDEAVGDLNGSQPHQVQWKNTKTDLIASAQSLQKVLNNAIASVKNARGLLEQRRFSELREIEWQVIWEQIDQAYGAYGQAESAFDVSLLEFTGKDEEKKKAFNEAERIVNRPAHRAASLLDDLNRTFADLEDLKKSELHILGGAGDGKTHVACQVCHGRLETGLPALLILGIHFVDGRPLTEQLRGILDIPPSYSWSDFLQALAAAAEAYHTRIPLIIDGLDGATLNGVFSNVWRLGLSGLAREIAQIKDLVLITTCRSNYRQAIWPSGTVENVSYMYGLDEYDIETAVEKYFAWYKIQADLTAVSLSQFKRPIYLKIFCESKNHTRQEEKHIYIGGQTLFEVFEEYLKQCNQAVCSRLGLHASVAIVAPGLQKTAAYLWQQRTRNIPLAQLAYAIDGQPLETLNWQSSRTKAILDEGLLVCRDWSNDQDVVYFTYDLLGGYIIAQYLLERTNDEIISFIQSEQASAMLFGRDFQALHPMHSDIGRCLAALLPVKIGQHLYKLSDDSRAFDLSIDAIFEIPPSNVNQDCVELIENLFQFPENRGPLLELATSTIGNVHHPLNASFWSKRLEELSMPERDISWTEYVRENVEQFEKTLTHFEVVCQSNKRLSEMTINRLRLIAEHTMWMLTSTVRPLRDKATRALYWYGRRFPSHFLDLMLHSLRINDPYVPERMLAATYGITMARQHDFGDPSFARDILPFYGRKLYEAMFELNAPHATTHILARDYARYVIEISLVHHPELLTVEERKRITPPFIDGGIREWGQSEDRDHDRYRAGDAPIQMDFANYTLGRLVKDRSNYDFEHEGYKVARLNIFWRIYELGYSLETFSNIDKRIADDNWRYGRSEDGGKTDRYGKKYSWIAFYELAGFRKDQGLLDEWYDARISDADIDPSFPPDCQQYELIRDDFLGDREMSVEEWISHGGLPNLEPYLIVNDLLGEQGPWVLLDGYINQENNEAARKRFIFPRGFIVKSEEAPRIAERLKQQDLGGRWLPEISGDYYTYAGEIPWCATYPYNDATELSFVVNTGTVTELVDRLALFRNNEPVDAAVEEEFWKSIADQSIEAGDSRIALGEIDLEKVIEAQLEEMGLEARIDSTPTKRRVDEHETFAEFIPVRDNNWESYHSAIVPGRHVSTPAKEIAERLDLCGQPQTFDLFEKNGKRASVTFCYGEPWHTYQILTYLRKDLLELYLTETGSELIWAVWGERGFYSDNMSKLDAFARRHKPHEVFQDIKAYTRVA